MIRGNYTKYFVVKKKRNVLKSNLICHGPRLKFAIIGTAHSFL